MGAGQEYWDELGIDPTYELPSALADDEEHRRLLYIAKKLMNGGRVTLRASGEGDVGDTVEVSPAWESYFGYTVEELEVLGVDFFVEESRPVAITHAVNKLAAPYAARCTRKVGGPRWQNVQGFNFKIGDIEWRAVVYEDYV